MTGRGESRNGIGTFVSSRKRRRIGITSPSFIFGAAVVAGGSVRRAPTLGQLCLRNVRAGALATCRILLKSDKLSRRPYGALDTSSCFASSSRCVCVPLCPLLTPARMLFRHTVCRMIQRMNDAATPLIPAAYDGREQALIKHRLLEDYLEKLFLIIGMGSKNAGGHIELCYIDCFAGPWGDPSEDMQTTSIAISLRTLDTCRQKLASMGVYVKIRALYVEAKPSSFGRLQTYLATATPRSIKSHCMQGDFVALRQQILDWIGPDAFTFFFVDPMGYTEIAVPTLAPLVRRPRSEFLINLMYDHANRAMSMEGMRETMATVLGEELDVTGLPPREREYAFVHTYRENLKRCVPASTSRPARAAHARVMNPERDRTKYHVVYLTSHPLGVVKFMEISAMADRVQAQVRAVKRDQKKAADKHM